MREAILVGRYELGDPVGVGAMGTVYRAADRHTGGTVAVKVLHPTLAHDPKYVERLRREARLAAAITSPRVVRVTDFGEHDGAPFLVMEYVEGDTLADVLERRGPLLLPEALTVALEVTRALDAAHARGIMHRDLKPQNIKLVDGQVKVLDFGIARLEGDAGVTLTGAYVGTPAYSAPERLAGRGDIRADIYAVGVILFELIAGRLPFGGATPLAMLYQHESVPPPPLPGDVPATVQDLIARCLAKAPSARYQTPSELVAALESALQAAGAPVVPVTTRAEAVAIAAPATEPTTATAELPVASTVPHNLPPPQTSFVGRARELAEIKRRMATTRMLTLTSTGGCGKTRLALQVAAEQLEHYLDGAWLVELASLSEPTLVPQAVAGALGIRETRDRPLIRTLVDSLKHRHMLLMLDNCEHLLAACAELAEELLDGCPGLHIIATSREVLGISGEAVYRVPSLSLPDPQHSLVGADLLSLVEECDAVQLFVERARWRRPDFALSDANAGEVAAICRRLDGIPLVLELVAVLIKGLPLEEITVRLDERFRLLTGTARRALSREQILRTVLDFSYDLLAKPEQELFRRLSVFAGAFEEQAAVAVCAGDTVGAGQVVDLLSRLGDALLVQAQWQGGAPRYQLLESLRQYGSEKLQAAGEAATVHGRHSDWYTDLAARAEPELTGPEQLTWLARLEQQHDNLRAALAWSFSEGHDNAGPLALAGALWRFWMIHGHFSEGRGWLERALVGASRADLTLRAKALNGLGVLAFQQGDYDEAYTRFEENLSARRSLEDQQGIAAALSSLGNVAWAQGDYGQARRWHEESLALRRRLGHTVGVASALNNLGTLESDCGAYDRAWAFHEESLSLRRSIADNASIAQSIHNLGEVAHRRGDHKQARKLWRQSLEMLRELGDRGSIAGDLGALARVAEALGEPERAARYFGAAAAVRDALGLPLGLSDFARYERSTQAVRAQLGDAAFTAAWDAGQGQPLEEIIADALAWGREPADAPAT